MEDKKQPNINTEDESLMDDIFEVIGFDDQKIMEHKKRLEKILMMSIINDLDKVTAFKEDKMPFPEKIETSEDLIKYYEKYTDRETIEKLIKENVVKIYSEYFNAILDELK